MIELNQRLSINLSTPNNFTGKHRNLQLDFSLQPQIIGENIIR